MGSEHIRGSRLATRCCHGVCFGFGFVLTALLLTVMFWIVWCYLGLTIVQVSDTQRRALVNYSYTTSTTSAPANRTSVPNLESSVNSISRSATTSTVLRGSSRDISTASPQLEGHKAAILSGGNGPDADDGIHARRVPTVTTHNRVPEPKEDARRDDIAPTQVYDNPRSSRPSTDETSRDDKRTAPREADRSPTRREDIQSSRRLDSDSSYRDPDFERDYPRSAPPSRERSRDRYDEDDERGSRGRYDVRERGRETDDRYSKGDTRVYPDDDRRTRDRFSDPDDDRKRRGDDDRDRDRDFDDRYRARDRDYEDRYRSRDSDEKYRDRVRDDDRYRDRDRSYDDRYRDRDVRYRESDRSRDDGYRSRDDDRGRPRDDERYRDRIRDEKYVDRDDEYRNRPRSDDERYREDVRSRDTDYRDRLSSSRVDDRPPTDKLPSLSVREDGRRSDYESPRDRSRTYVRDELVESRSRTSSRVDDERYRDDDYKRPSSRYDERDRIAPTRVRDESEASRPPSTDARDREYTSRLSSLDGRRRDEDRQVGRDDPGYDDHRKGVDARPILPSSVRRPSDEREEYRTRLPDERRTSDPKYVDRRDEVVLDRRSYASEEDDEYRRSNSRTRAAYDDRDDARRDYRGDDDYVRRPLPDDDEYRRSRTRGDYDATDRTRTRDRYDRDYGRYDDDRDRAASKTYDRDEDEVRRRDPDSSSLRKDSTLDSRSRRPRPEIVDERPTRAGSYIEPEDDRRSLGGGSRYRDEGPRSIPRRGSPTGSSASSAGSDGVVIREKRFQSSLSTDRSRRDSIDSSPERPLSAQDVIEAALRHSDVPEQNSRKVFYPVFDPRVSNLTSPEIIRPSERRGITITSRRRRRTLRL